ncbi:lipocalin-like domain-containing protein [Zoogloea dura]|uniref:Carotenoid 1,2-hydratase n=1 Tax=Zoogloea dura TaxID=2728840 RepID=A0A848G8H5_9RHOO|nr:lipocalin-like domain-containing protein [Zoogloea dura]NML27574.1 carotenoid 1,2-hydratase [Zoogloea dura]
MQRRRFLLTLPVLAAGPAVAVDFAPVLPGRALVFPADHGAHPAFRTEWWYATGWLALPDGQPLGFQVTFFRVRTGIGEGNPSAFAPRQLILAHAAIADPRLGRLRPDERSARVGVGPAGFDTATTRVWVGDWRFELRGDRYQAEVTAADFAYRLEMVPDAPPLLQGQGGFSRKAADPRHASYYYSRPQLRVSGELSLDGRRQPVSGQAWLDHEWSSELLPEGAQGWDWVGLNLDDGSGLMAFRLRDAAGKALWSAGTLRPAGPSGKAQPMAPEDIVFTPLRVWQSPRSGIGWPVEWQLQLGSRTLLLRPLMDDQELDSRRSTGAIYWEGAVRVFEGAREVGRGYLELTGYGKRIRVG